MRVISQKTMLITFLTRWKSVLASINVGILRICSFQKFPDTTTPVTTTQVPRRQVTTYSPQYSSVAFTKNYYQRPERPPRPPRPSIERVGVVASSSSSSTSDPVYPVHSLMSGYTGYTERPERPTRPTKPHSYNWAQPSSHVVILPPRYK